MLGRAVKMLSFRMRSKLRCYQLKIDFCRCELLHTSLVVTTGQKPMVSTWKMEE